jgi:hypothetical protein
MRCILRNMTRRLRLALLAAAAGGGLALLAGCAGHFLSAEREPWRHEAELQCINSGAVKEGPGKVRISPIDGPGMCGADFPLKVSSLGDEVPLSYDEPRPPAAIPNAGANAGQAPPRWPLTSRPSGAVTRDDLPPVPGSGAPYGSQPLSIDPPADRAGASGDLYDFRKPYGATASPSARAAAAPDPNSPYDYSPVPYDRRQPIGNQAIGDPRSRSVASPPPPPALGPVRATPVSAGPVTVSPAATLACPLVSVLDQWIDEAVQPAAVKWLGAPVVEIKQISAYSCRGMNGDPNATISEHAFGNALDIAAFTLADGRKLDVQHGWYGTPEEQAFLHELQATACDRFTTVLAPGSNVYHYNHIHVDLMRRRNERHACNPHAVTGDEMAARLGAHVAARRVDPAVTGSIGPHRAAATPLPPRMRPSAYTERKYGHVLPEAVPGADGED